jgi:hypothetical protein
MGWISPEPKFKTEQKIIVANSPHDLNKKIEDHVKEGWKCVGSHTAIQLHAQLRYAGNQHKDTVHSAEYAQTMKKVSV